MQEKHISGDFDFNFTGGILHHVAKGIFEFFSGWCAADHIHRDHVDGDQELGQGQQMIRIPGQSHFFTVEIGMHVRDDIHELTPFQGETVWHIHPGDAAENIHKGIRSFQPHGQVKQLARHLAFGIQGSGRRAGCQLAKSQCSGA